MILASIWSFIKSIPRWAWIVIAAIVTILFAYLSGRSAGRKVEAAKVEKESVRAVRDASRIQDRARDTIIKAEVERANETVAANSRPVRRINSTAELSSDAARILLRDQDDR
jgi:hypothetical protein